MSLTKHAIQSYFTSHDYFIRVNFNSKINHNDEPAEQSISINELMAILTTRKPSLLEKAVILCKFHRGLDASTLVVRFNFEVWDQIVKWFGSAEIDSWDLDKCPGVRKCIRNDRVKKFNLDSHELCDLLKSTLIDCGCMLYVADHVIGHKPKDSYEKQVILYIDSFRTEYLKASKKLNLFIQFGNVVSGKKDITIVTQQFEGKIQELQNKLDSDENYRIRQERQTQNQNRKLEKLYTEIHNLKNNMNSDLKQTLQKLEFCCASCSVIHSKDHCPNCGSKYVESLKINNIQFHLKFLIYVLDHIHKI